MTHTKAFNEKIAFQNATDPAFPRHPLQQSLGLTIRDYFAAQALSAMARETQNTETRLAICRNAYAWADSMLQVRGTP